MRSYGRQVRGGGDARVEAFLLSFPTDTGNVLTRDWKGKRALDGGRGRIVPAHRSLLERCDTSNSGQDFMCMYGDRSCVYVRRMRGKRLMGRMYVDLEVMRELDGPSGVVTVQVDTGSDDSALPRPFLKKLGIRPVGWEWYELADGRRVRRQYGVAFLRLMGQVGASRVVFAGPKDPPLLGVIALEQLGFEIDPRRAILRKHRRQMISIRRPRTVPG